MDTVVNKLLDVDKQARMIIDEAQQYYDRTISDITGEKHRLTAEYEEKAEAHLNQIKDAEAGSVTEAASEIKARYEKLTANIDRVYDEKHTQWEDALFNKCVGR